MNKHKQSGFTLVELMVTITISALLLAGGLTSYTRFNSRQTLTNSVRGLQLLLRTAQKQARVESKPTGCTRLVSYAVQVAAANMTAANLIAECTNQNYTLQTLQFDSGVSSKAAFNIHFLVLQGGVTGATTINLTNGTLTGTFSVDQGGEVTDVVVQ